MNNLNQEIIEKHSDKEKQIVDEWIAKRGISVTIKPPSLLDEDKKPKHPTYDDFEIDVPRVSIRDEYVSTKDYKVEDEVITQLIFEISSFGEFKPVTYGEMIAYLQENHTTTETANNFDLLYAYVKYDKIMPNGTIITFNDFQNMEFIVSNIEKKRQFSKVFRYTLNRT